MLINCFISLGIFSLGIVVGLAIKDSMDNEEFK
jgi:hypothetical protein